MCVCLCAYIERDKCRYIDTNMYVCIHTFANTPPRVVPGTRGGGSATPRGAVPEVRCLECMVGV